VGTTNMPSPIIIATAMPAIIATVISTTMFFKMNSQN
jgi:hypothetical protein